MKFGILTGLLIGTSGLAAMAQQTAPNQPQVQVPAVQAAGSRPGGISFVTRRNGTVGNILAANSLWVAGGVPVVAATGASGTVIGSATFGVAGANRPGPSPTSTTALVALRQLADRGDANAKRALAALGAPPR